MTKLNREETVSHNSKLCRSLFFTQNLEKTNCFTVRYIKKRDNDGGNKMKKVFALAILGVTMMGGTTFAAHEYQFNDGAGTAAMSWVTKSEISDHQDTTHKYQFNDSGQTATMNWGVQSDISNERSSQHEYQFN